jgi:hypothetical protein
LIRGCDGAADAVAFAFAAATDAAPLFLLDAAATDGNVAVIPDEPPGKKDVAGVVVDGVGDVCGESSVDNNDGDNNDNGNATAAEDEEEEGL